MKKLPKRLKPKNKHLTSQPFIVMGLGNPGPQYERTRHNAGYHVVDLLMREPPLHLRRRLFASYLHLMIPGGMGQRSMLLVRSTTYMNHSGDIVPSVLRRYSASVEDLIVIVDNMDLQPGTCRLKKGGGDAGHNGLKSLINRMGSGDFYRLYIGVGRPSSGVSIVDHVLGIPESEEAMNIRSACFKAASSIMSLKDTAVARVMEELNRREN